MTEIFQTNFTKFFCCVKNILFISQKLKSNNYKIEVTKFLWLENKIYSYFKLQKLFCLI